MGKHKEKSRNHKRRDSSSSDEWVEKEQKPEPKQESKRDEWMSLSSSFSSESHLDRRKQREERKRLEKEQAQYNPRNHTRELNPYWKDGGDGLPKFKKPDEEKTGHYEPSNRYKSGSNWRKKSEPEPVPQPSSSKEVEVLSDKELNVLASKLLKAEIMGKTELVKELKGRLENARQQRENAPKFEEVVLTQTDSRGHSRPVRSHSYQDPYQKKKRKVETHQDGQRVRYFADDDKHSLQQMFENEKFHSVQDQNYEFAKLAGKTGKNDDLDEIFEDKIRKEDDKSQRHRDRAINEHQRVVKSVDNCKFCLQSDSMPKHLMVSVGETAFLCLPAFEPLTEGHCFICPIRHVSCATLLDENEWEDIQNFRKSLTKMYSSKDLDVVFFETAKNLDKYPHMCIECVPIDREEGHLAPIYFKKAIDECEEEWAQNKKLVSLKGKDVRRAVPKGLSYFFVSFGMEEGFAHVIEDEKYFPYNFAQEIIGGMLDLHHSKWRKPRQQSFSEQSQRVVEFAKDWDSFDHTKN